MIRGEGGKRTHVLKKDQHTAGQRLHMFKGKGFKLTNNYAACGTYRCRLIKGETDKSTESCIMYITDMKDVHIC